MKSVVNDLCVHELCVIKARIIKTKNNEQIIVIQIGFPFHCCSVINPLISALEVCSLSVQSGSEHTMTLQQFTEQPGEKKEREN